MDVTYHAVNFAARPEDRATVERELGKVNEYVAQFPRAAWHVELEHSPRKGGFGVSLHVVLPARSLFATGWGGDLRTAAEVAAEKVLRQAKKHLDRLRKDERAGAETLRAGRPAPPPAPADLATIRDREDFADHLAEHSARLQRFLRRECRLLRQAGRDLSRVSMPDVVEDALTYVFEHFAEKPKTMSPDRWLIRRGLLLLHEAIETDERLESAPAGDGYAGETPEDWEELMGLADRDDVPMDGRAADAETTSPELLRDRRRAQTAVAEGLAALPARQRQALVLRHLEGYEPTEIAYVLNADVDQVDSWIEEAEVALQSRLQRFRRL